MFKTYLDLGIKLPDRGKRISELRSGDLIVWSPRSTDVMVGVVLAQAVLCLRAQITPKPYYEADLLVLLDDGDVISLPCDLGEVLPKEELHIIFIQSTGCAAGNP